ncbi:G-protein coupled receptor GRL101-like [Macrobrachium nipponense]|uniref:G-protein coupled receptor GRL101-like n=1 Tax=Macrobrachium nipponense TaxID=159736 RepID=UPI0030C7D807
MLEECEWATKFCWRVFQVDESPNIVEGVNAKADAATDRESSKVDPVPTRQNASHFPEVNISRLHEEENFERINVFTAEVNNTLTKSNMAVVERNETLESVSAQGDNITGAEYSDPSLISSMYINSSNSSSRLKDHTGKNYSGLITSPTNDKEQFLLKNSTQIDSRTEGASDNENATSAQTAMANSSHSRVTDTIDIPQKRNNDIHLVESDTLADFGDVTFGRHYDLTDELQDDTDSDVIMGKGQLNAMTFGDDSHVPCDVMQMPPHQEKVFFCGPGECIPQQLKCNGVPECANGTDESVRECGCLPNEYQCDDTCIDLVRRCDRKDDCPDGADELNCETWVCPTTHFKCNNHYCILVSKSVISHDHCGDGSDEHQCHHRECWKQEFECSNGQCIRPGRVCDGQPHCKDGSDESACGNEDFAVCGSGKRVHRFYWCDGWPDCQDNHADELNCGECDASRQFQCANTRCVSISNVCDSLCDCLSNCEDEANCTTGAYDVSGGISICNINDTLMCTVANHDRSLDRCIAPAYICDGHNDCHNGQYISDEYGCDVEECSDLEKGEEKFRCSDGRCLSSRLVCDFWPDCLHAEDEGNCSHRPCNNSEWRCDNGQCIRSDDRCNLVFNCFDKSDELRCEENLCQEGHLRCNNGQCIPAQLWCDWVPDCADRSDETNCSRPTSCRSNEFRCSSGQCIDEQYRCDAAADNRHACADRSHLIKCSSYECRKDQWRCGSGACLSPDLVCDGQIHCPLTWDDEDHCPFSCSSSSPYCKCQDISIDCQNFGMMSLPSDIERQISRFYLAGNYFNNTLSTETFLIYRHLVFLDLSNNSITYLPKGIFLHLNRLRILDLRHNFLTHLENSTFLGLVNLRTLHLIGNTIYTLDGWALYGLSSLSTLDLSRQRMSNISRKAFMGLRTLVSLNLSGNHLTYLPDASLSGLSSLLSLDIRNNEIAVMGPRIFSGLAKLEYLWTDEFRFCCLARQVKKCSPPPDEFSSCEDLMTNTVLRICAWILGTVALSGNLLVIIWRTFFDNDNKVHSFLITHLALGDLCMGLYLLIIAIVDVSYRGVYFIYDAVWRTSPLCQLAGFLSTFSSELSVFTLTVITLERFLVIIFPFRLTRLDMRWTRRIMACVWVSVGLLAALPLLNLQYFKNFYGRSGVCLALHITHEKPNGWEYSVFVFLVVNLLSFSIIAASYLGMYWAASSTSAAVRSDLHKRESSMARRMTLIVVTDAACWLPIICLGIVSLAGVRIPPQVFAWVAVFVLPLNAAVNPLLYTLTTRPS